MRSSAGNDFQNMPFEEATTQPKCCGYGAMLWSKVNQCPASHIFFCMGYPHEMLMLGLYFPPNWIFPFQKSCVQTLRSTVVAHAVGTPALQELLFPRSCLGESPALPNCWVGPIPGTSWCGSTDFCGTAVASNEDESGLQSFFWTMNVSASLEKYSFQADVVWHQILQQRHWTARWLS